MAVVKRTNNNILKGINQQMEQLQGLEGKVGWYENHKYPDGTSIAYVATIQEYGYGPIPPRPFMRPTISEQKQAWLELIRKGAAAILSGSKTPKDVMWLLTERAENDIQKKIASITEPPLSPATLRARRSRSKDGKISTKPLNDTGTMIATLNHTVDDATS